MAHCGHRRSGSFCKVPQKWRTVDTGGQEAFATEGTAKMAHCGHRRSGSFCNKRYRKNSALWTQAARKLLQQKVPQKWRTVDTGGQEAFVTEGTAKRSDTITVPPSIVYEIKFCTIHPLFLKEQKLCVTVSFALCMVLSSILDIFPFILLCKRCGTV